MSVYVRSTPSPFRLKLGLAMQGMGIWHLALGLVAAVFLVLVILSTRGEADDSDGAAMTGLATIVVGGGALLAGLVFTCVSAILLRGSIIRSQWSLVLIPGIVGTAVVFPASIIGWPLSEGVGLFVAYKMVQSRLRKQPSFST